MNSTDAQRLREARERAGLSVLELGHKFGVQTAFIYALESGRRGAGVKTLRLYVEHGLMTSDEALHVNGGEAA